MRLKGKTVSVTAADPGIGRANAPAMAPRSAEVWAVGAIPAWRECHAAVAKARVAQSGVLGDASIRAGHRPKMLFDRTEVVRRAAASASAFVVGQAFSVGEGFLI